MRTTRLPSGEALAVLGQGTKGMAERPENHVTEIDALRLGLDLGLRVIETGEAYAGGAAEELVGKAITGRRTKAFLVSKLLPEHSSRQAAVTACEHSLRRLATDMIDLYMLDGRGQAPFAETLEAFNELTRNGKIRYWGVRNFDATDMEELVKVGGGAAAQVDEMPYNLAHREIESELLPWCARSGIVILACSPLAQGHLPDHAELQRIASDYSATPAQVALAWTVRSDRVITIPKAAAPGHVKQNRIALDLPLTDADFAALDRAFPAPAEKQPPQSS
jgi:diketogulonate reductase-like aldo/keto reductase